METLILVGVILGLLCGVLATMLFYKRKGNQQIEEQSTMLLERVKKVCKLVTVEGEFTELFTHKDAKNVFFNLLIMKKKALIIVKAKVLIGFDLRKINFEANSATKQVILSNFPEPEIISMETDLEYYDVNKGIINQFSEKELTSMNKKSKDFIRKKVEESHLVEVARHQAADTIAIIRPLVESVGWELVIDKHILETATLPALSIEEDIIL